MREQDIIAKDEANKELFVFNHQIAKQHGKTEYKERSAYLEEKFAGIDGKLSLLISQNENLEEKEFWITGLMSAAQGIQKDAFNVTEGMGNPLCKNER